MSTEGFERRLEELLHRQGDPVGDPEVHLPDLRRVGDRELARRRGLIAAAVATAAVLVVAVVPLAGDRLVSRSIDPVGPATPVPSTLRPGPVPLVRGDVVVAGEVEVPLGRDGGVTYRGGTTLVGPYYRYAEDVGPWRVVGADGVVDLAGTTTGAPVLSADGTRAAWVTRGDGGGGVRLVLHDLSAGGRDAEDVVPAPAQGVLVPVGIDEQDRVFLQDTRDGLLTMWTPGSDPVPVTGLQGIPAEHPWPGGVATIPTAENTGQDATLYEVADDGTATAVGSASRYDVWSPDGDLVAGAAWQPGSELLPGFGPEVLVEDGSGAPEAMPAPGDGPPAGAVTGVMALGWESEDVVTSVVLYDEGKGLRQAYWRCDVVAGACETVVDDLPPAPGTDWPDVPVQR